MIKIALLTDKSEKHSLVVVRVKKDDNDNINTVVVDGKESAKHLELIGLKAAFRALGNSNDELEIHSLGKNINSVFEKDSDGWSKKYQEDGDIVSYLRISSSSFRPIKTRKLHKQEANKMRKIAEDKLEELKKIDG